MASSASLPSSVTGTDSPSSSTDTPVAGSPQPGTNTSTLYLVTFLATILVLVLLSGSLLLRSYILRRRYRARLQQAIADGLFVDLDRAAFTGPGLFTPMSFAGPLGRSTGRLGAKPVLWETHVSPKETEYSDLHFWSSITPIALRLTSPPTPESPSTSPESPSSPQQRPSIFSYLHRPRSISPFPSRSPGSPTPPQSQSPTEPSQTNLTGTQSPPQDSAASPNISPSTDGDSGSVSVCVLISIPDAHAPRSSRVSDNDKGKPVGALDAQSHQQGDDTSPAPGLSSQKRPFNTGPDKDTFPLVEFGVIEMKVTDLPRAI